MKRHLKKVAFAALVVGLLLVIIKFDHKPVEPFSQVKDVSCAVPTGMV